MKRRLKTKRNHNPAPPMKAPKPIPSGDPVKFATSDVDDAVWPVKTSNARKFEVNYRAVDDTDVGDNTSRQFLARRNGGARYHVGIDLYADHRDKVVACEDGRIVSFYTFLLTSAGEESYALVVEHEDFVINYGEVKGTAQQVFGWRIGDRVTKGQEIAEISTTGMLHFETYIPGTAHNQRWPVGGDRPNRLLNPTQYLLNLAAAAQGIDGPVGGTRRSAQPADGSSGPFVRAVALTNPRRVEYFDANNCKQTKTGGSRSWRNNNPGNIICGQFTNNHGAIGCDKNTQPTAAIFPSMEIGRAAQIALLRTQPYQTAVGRAMDRWTGKPNNTDYRACVRNGSGIAMDRQMGSLSDDEYASLVKAMQHCEGFKEGTISDLVCP